MGYGQINSFTYNYNIPGETTTFTIEIYNNVNFDVEYTFSLDNHGLIINTFNPYCNGSITEYTTTFTLGGYKTKIIEYTKSGIVYGLWIAGIKSTGQPGSVTSQKEIYSPTINIYTNISYYNPSEPTKSYTLTSGYGYIDTSGSFVFHKSIDRSITLSSGNNYSYESNIVYDEPYGNLTYRSSYSCGGGPYFPPFDKFKVASILRDTSGNIIDKMVIDENGNVISGLSLYIHGINSIVR